MHGIRMNEMPIFDGKDPDQLTITKSHFTNRSRFFNNKKNDLMINKANIVTDAEKINQQINEDENIDLDKIKKYFENVINEKHFLANYDKAKTRGDDGRFVDETTIRM